MGLDQIEVTGFKSIPELKLKLRRLNILTGANGSGKSNFIALWRARQKKLLCGISFKSFWRTVGCM
jgi:predicted ATPase